MWKIQPLPKPTEGHAADAIEIVNGEPVRKVTLPRIDFAVYTAHEAAAGKTAREVALAANLPVDVTTAAINRLVAAGLIRAGVNPSIQ